MSLQSKYILMCDEVRQEVSGKLLIIGLYTPDIGLTQIPFTLPYLTFLLNMESDRPGSYQMRFTLSHLESGQQIANGMGGFAVQRPGQLVIPVPIPGVRFSAPGAYTFSLHVEGERDPFTSSFAVQLLAPQPVPGFQMPNLGRH